MPSTRRFMDLYRGDNEWLAQPPPADDTTEEWERAWEELKANCPHQIEFTEEMYNNQEYGEKPEWIDVTLRDDCVLVFKMARGVIKAIDANSITYADSKYFVVNVSNDFRYGFAKLHLHEDRAYVTVYHKDGNEEVEVDITEFFNQAIGE